MSSSIPPIEAQLLKVVSSGQHDEHVGSNNAKADRSKDTFELNPDLIDLLKSDTYARCKQVKVFSIFGPARCAKSWIMNRIPFESLDDWRDLFQVSDKATTCTKGANIYAEVDEKTDTLMVFIDVEGEGDVSNNLDYNTNLLLFVLVVSSSLIFNLLGYLHDDHLKLLKVAKDIAKDRGFQIVDIEGQKVETKDAKGSSNKSLNPCINPHLWWLIRDFNLKSSFQSDNAWLADQLSKPEVQHILRDFRSWHIHRLPAPVDHALDTEEKKAAIREAGEKDLQDSFVKKYKAFREDLIQNTPPRQVKVPRNHVALPVPAAQPQHRKEKQNDDDDSDGEEDEEEEEEVNDEVEKQRRQQQYTMLPDGFAQLNLVPSTFADLLVNIVNSINSSKFQIASAFDQMINTLLPDAIENARMAFTQVAAASTNTLPLNGQAWKDLVVAASKEATTAFMNTSALFTSDSKRVVIEQEIDKLKAELVEKNRAASNRVCEGVAAEIQDAFTQRVDDEASPMEEKDFFDLRDKLERRFRDKAKNCHHTIVEQHFSKTFAWVMGEINKRISKLHIDKSAADAQATAYKQYLDERENEEKIVAEQYAHQAQLEAQNFAAQQAAAAQTAALQKNLDDMQSALEAQQAQMEQVQAAGNEEMMKLLQQQINTQTKQQQNLQEFMKTTIESQRRDREKFEAENLSMTRNIQQLVHAINSRPPPRCSGGRCTIQ